MADLLATFQKFYVEIRDAGGANFAFLYELDHLGPRVLDRCTGVIRPMKLIEVDAFDAQPAKRRFAFAPYGIGLEHATWFCHGIIAVPDQAAFCEDMRPVGRRQVTQKAPDNFFGMAQTVDCRRIDPVDPQVEGVSYGGDGIGVVLWSPSKRPPSTSDRPRAKSNCCDIESAGTQRASRQCHVALLFLRIDLIERMKYLEVCKTATSLDGLRGR